MTKGRTKTPICNMDCLNCIHPDCINDRVEKNYYQELKCNNPEAYRRRVEAIKANVTARYNARKKAGLCVRCGKVKVTTRAQCDACAKRNAELQRQYVKRKRVN